MVNTVLGPMETSEMGRTLMHEHAVCFDIALKKAFGKKWVDEDAAIELIVKELSLIHISRFLCESYSCGIDVVNYFIYWNCLYSELV